MTEKYVTKKKKKKKKKNPEKYINGKSSTK